MILNKVKYSEHINTNQEWKLDELTLSDINLIVGLNSSGKTRTLNAISGFSKILLSPKVNISHGSFTLNFVTNDSKPLKYLVEIDELKVKSEKLLLDGKVLIKRNKDGAGEIMNATGKYIKFKIPCNELIALRRDEIQYPYLNYLNDWASGLRHFRFAKEKEPFALSTGDIDNSKGNVAGLRETERAIRVFIQGKKKHNNDFVKSVIDDMNNIGYQIENVDIGPLESIQVESPVQGKVVGLRLKEADRAGLTDQHVMSDGMFRALSIIIHFNYYMYEKRTGITLIDDIGEGLDYERSSKLIKLLIDKSLETGSQLIMSTNDKFVMNNTSLKYWQVISREGGSVKIFNNENSKEIFDQFRFTGLNNFEFLTTDFYKKGFK